jgi:hypothetical protein
MLVKGFQIEPMLYLVGILGLISLRSRTLGRKTAQAASRMS